MAPAVPQLTPLRDVGALQPSDAQVTSGGGSTSGTFRKADLDLPRVTGRSVAGQDRQRICRQPLLVDRSLARLSGDVVEPTTVQGRRAKDPIRWESTDVLVEVRSLSAEFLDVLVEQL